MAAYVLHTVFSLLRVAPHALYADQWRQYTAYLQQAFPLNVIAQDNSHRLILPNLVAVLELSWFGGNQWLQLFVGAVCATTAASLAAWACLRDASIIRTRRAAAAFLCFFAIFWLGNTRTLFHSTELLHTTMPMCFLAAALAFMLRGGTHGPGVRDAVWASLLAAAAAFSFGYGMAVFVGVIMVALLRRSRLPVLLALGVGLLGTAAGYILLPGGGGVSGTVVISPPENLLVAARWLGAPFVTLFVYLWDPSSAPLVPVEALRATAAGISGWLAPHLGNLRQGWQVQAVLGATGMVALLFTSLRTWRSAAPIGPMRAMGFGIAWFGLAAAGIVSLSRLGYFQQYPDQIYAERYMPWPCLFWLGLALLALSAKAGPTGRVALSARIVAAFCGVLPLLAIPTQRGGVITASLTRSTIDVTAVGTLVGVVEQSELGETFADELQRGLPLLRAAHVAQFAWPEAALLGTTASATSERLRVENLAARSADNILSTPGSAVTVTLEGDQSIADRLLLADPSGKIVGLLSRDTRKGERTYSGYASGLYDNTPLSVVR